MSRNNTALGMPAFKQTNKRLPQNKKYSNVTSKTDTGSSMSKAIARSDYIKANYRYKQGEVFRRMKASTLAQLVIEDLECSFDIDSDDLDEAATFMAPQEFTTQYHTSHRRSLPNDKECESTASDRSGRSTLLSVIHGVGALDTSHGIAPAPPPKLQPPRCPFLLLDLRDPTEYDKCHIRGARNFHHVRLSRAHDSWTPEMYQYINKPDKVIIMYDEDEMIATKAATTFVQRGINNCFMLSGGLKVFADKIPLGLVLGVLPSSCQMHRSAKHIPDGTASRSLARLTKENVTLIRDRLEESLGEGSVASELSTSRTSQDSRATSRAKSSATTSTRAWR
eukprot:m.101933 g.101933  ORF g.101933 m.101933 type:complete len:337 (+) comp27366_c0_seq4:515-1525(+)